MDAWGGLSVDKAGPAKVGPSEASEVVKVAGKVGRAKRVRELCLSSHSIRLKERGGDVRGSIGDRRRSCIPKHPQSVLPFRQSPNVSHPFRSSPLAASGDRRSWRSALPLGSHLPNVFELRQWLCEKCGSGIGLRGARWWQPWLAAAWMSKTRVNWKKAFDLPVLRR